MPIPLAQLQTWSGQGAKTTSASTYAAIQSALENPDAQYQNRNFTVFLQGSYGNDTNIYDESDVDVVIRYDGAFVSDIMERPADEQAAFNAAYPNGTYLYNVFKAHVQQALRSKFGNAVGVGKKAINVDASGNRRKADVIVAFEYRRYYKFKSIFDDSHVTGIAFILSDGTLVANYPKQHSENLTTKHQATSGKFKPLTRIFKNMRSKMEDDGLIVRGSAPSYYIEGLLYNVPNSKFVGDYQDILFNILDWLHATPDRSDFLCANEQYYLLRDGFQTCWNRADGANFIGAAIKLWNEW